MKQYAYEEWHSKHMKILVKICQSNSSLSKVIISWLKKSSKNLIEGSSMYMKNETKQTWY